MQTRHIRLGIQNGPTLANMLLAQAHLDEQIQVGEGEHVEQETGHS
jgi:hypothetical protein